MSTAEEMSAHRRARGAYYTPNSAAEYMASWAVRASTDRILEPSAGDGAFVDAVSRAAVGAGLDAPALTAFEYHRDTYLAHLCQERDGLLLQARCEDFLAASPEPHSAVIGNPPFVRLRNLPAAERRTAATAAHRWLGEPMDPSGSTWMPFVLQATQFLQPGGRLCLVLPFEFTYVRYARPLWRFLGRHFGSLRVVRILERLFPDILQGVVLLFAEGKGHQTSAVDFEAYERFSDLLGDQPVSRAQLSIDDIVTGRPFTSALLSQDLRDLLTGRLGSVLSRSGSSADFRIGYVAGDKHFFHPDAPTIAAYDLPKSSLTRAVTSTRRLRGGGLSTSGLPESATSWLFKPKPGKLTDGDQDYIRHGRSLGVHLRYKCQIRDPWYDVPYVRPPDLILSVFSERTLVLLNDAGLVASNSLLCAYMHPGQAAMDFVRRWYTNLTQLSIELNVHSLGGGVLVMVPREASSDQMVSKAGLGATKAQIDKALRAGNLDEAYAAGDASLTKAKVIRDADLDLVYEGIDLLRRWRLLGS